MLYTFVTQGRISVRSILYRAGIRFWAAMAVIVWFFTSSYAYADEIVLVGGDVIHGKITERSALGIILDHNDLGRLEIPKDNIRSVSFDSSEIDEPETLSKETEITEESVWFEPDFAGLDVLSSKIKEKGWSFSADIALDNSYGNTEEQTMRFGLNAKRLLPDRRLDMDASYYNKTSEGSATDNKFSAGATRDWLLLESPLFFFVTGRYDYDEFESWLHRLAGHAGPGYHLIANDRVTLDLRVGAGARKEWGSENTNVRPEALGGADFDWKITAKQTIQTKSYIYPVFSDLEDYRARTTVNWRFLISKEMKLSFLVGLLHEYQSIVDPDKDKNDLRIYTGIHYEF